MSARTLTETPTRRLVTVAGAVCLTLLAGCGADQPEADEVAAAEPAAASDAVDTERPRVYFVQPTDGATLSADETTHVMFEVEHFGIEPVEEGVVHEGMGHHHLAIDGECLPPGTVIPKADPWIHFGDGTNMIDVQLPPGEHTLTLQIGDGEHRTLDEPGLCATITVNVEGGDATAAEPAADEG